MQTTSDNNDVHAFRHLCYAAAIGTDEDRVTVARRAANAAMARQPKAPRHGGAERQMNGTHANAARADGPSSPHSAKRNGDGVAAKGGGVDGKHSFTVAHGRDPAASAVPNGNIAGGSGRAEPHVNGTSGAPVKQSAAPGGSWGQVAGQLHEHVRQQLQAAPFPDQHRGMVQHDPPPDKVGGQRAASSTRFSGAADSAAVRQADPLPAADVHENGHAEPRVVVISPPRAAGHAHAGSGNQQRRQQPPIMQFGTFTDDSPVKSAPAAPPQLVNHAGHAFNQSVAAALGLAAARPSAAASPATVAGPASGGKPQQDPAVAATPAAAAESPASAGVSADGSAGGVMTDSSQGQNANRQQQGARRGRGGSAYRGGRGPQRGRHSPVHSKHERDGRVLEVVR